MAWSSPSQAGYNIWTGTYTIGRDEVQAGIAKRFPVGLRYMEMFEVKLTSPRVALLPQTNRLSVTVDATVRNPLFLPTPVPGVLEISSGLKFDAQARAVRLHEPTAERLTLQGLSAADSRNLQALGATVARELLRDYPLHTFTEDELRLGNRKVEIGDITVTDAGLAVEVR
ncbi:DUF1439 domain-containing protein [Xylophilus ampelinus]|uniref:Uncharacterized protein DUF1439 n=2 Tax=Xylophilus ampelinus TaxID=54067 RepID=A0A318SRR0_9BURK|nr:DUF1439 domain-containing protein [Xylophilus ampelinus]PYE79880.1 uncharacterized protein DUF1439 [Xylophilus ampelinus]